MAYEWLNKKSRIFLNNGYLKENESGEDRIIAMADNSERILNKKGFADRVKFHSEEGNFLFSSPVWSNFGNERGLPIACFGSFCGDSMESILKTVSEVSMMTKSGGGTSAYLGDVRPRGSAISTGGKTDGAVAFMRMFDTAIDVCKQAQVRRGVMACYLPIEHGDIKEFLEIKHEGSPIQHLFTGVSVGNEWLNEMIDGDREKREIWASVIKSRTEIGLPYLFFRDNANDNSPKVYRDKGKKILASNVCNEISLSSDEDESFVCCLGSLNLLNYDKWKDTDAVEVMAYFLDSVLTEFIEKGEKIPYMERAVRFAKNQRAIGIGATGWHSYLQSKMIPFEGLQAQLINSEMFQTINDQSLAASKKAAIELGEPPLLKGYGERWVTRTAVAPNTSSAFILGQCSQSIEPYFSNYYVKDLAKIKTTIKNPYLEKLLEEKGENTEEIWSSILRNSGSVQHLKILTQEEKDVFRTFPEISQKEIIIQAIERQKYICQSQSVNLSIPADTDARELNELLLYSWRGGLKGLYYQHSTNAAQTFYRKLNECSSCEG
jgi:ribonucleoside-diphosphate reductase alpha chain